MSVDVVWVVTYDVIIELTVLKDIVGVECYISLHVLLSPLGGHCYVLPCQISNRWVFCAEIVVV
jgi:hypothetical protein